MSKSPNNPSLEAQVYVVAIDPNLARSVIAEYASESGRVGRHSV